jgi:hypothetical protein
MNRATQVALWTVVVFVIVIAVQLGFVAFGDQSLELGPTLGWALVMACAGGLGEWARTRKGAGSRK